ncbi:MAG TPA: NADH-quinone oxidoreductase subunit L, partial [Methylomirabilota bacterium]|nr:NADH-quinone oxidoreductase subunit L [Methylomirabilota bacterium]
YTFRLLFLAFSGTPRMSKQVLHHAHESPWVMTAPLVVLSLLTVVAGFVLGLPLEATRFARFLAGVFARPGGGHGVLVPLLSVLVFVAGFGLAFARYKRAPVRAESIGQPRTAVHRLLLEAYYVDALYERAVVRPLFALSGFLASVVDLGVIDGLVIAAGRAVVRGAAALRRLQTGYVVNYALTMLAGAVVVAGYLLTR